MKVMKTSGTLPQCPVDFGLGLNERHQNIVFYTAGTHTKYTSVRRLYTQCNFCIAHLEISCILASKTTVTKPTTPHAMSNQAVKQKPISIQRHSCWYCCLVSSFVGSLMMHPLEPEYKFERQKAARGEWPDCFYMCSG